METMPRSLIIATIALIAIKINTVTAATTKVKTISRPVHEITNEQARQDSQLRTTKVPGNLPYGNPLAGNSQQNARIHAQNQQAMFNAERVRQHRAQLQRWTKAPIQMDSYMKAYHESQENHQIALEKQQVPEPDKKSKSEQSHPVTAPPQKKRQVTKIISRGLRTPELTKITKADAITPDKNRSHRSYGSDYQQYLANKRYQSVFVSPAPTYDQGVTIKPNGNVGISELSYEPEQPKLLTEAVPSKTQYIYPKQYGQMQSYQSNQDALNSLLKKNPTDQLSQLSALLQASKDQDTKETDTPVDLYFYMRDPSLQTLDQQYDEKYAEVPQNYASAYMADQIQFLKDHTPIKEDIPDDIADPQQNNRIRGYGVQPSLNTQVSFEPIVTQVHQPLETTTTKSNNYYKIEVASQSISAPSHSYSSISHPVATHSHNSIDVHPVKYFQPAEPTEKPHLEGYPLPTYAPGEKLHGDLSELYLHHNARPTGVQHLTEDGSGVSAYGEDGENLHYAANYEFGYRVRDQHTGNDFGHAETKHGENTNGFYHVLLPDGRMQKVKYSAGPEGFHADISYDHLQYEH